MYRVSVVMPVYNNEKTLRQAIESILNQSIYDLELILINDGSTDASAQICEEYAKKEPLLVEVIHQKRRGFGVARNRGLYKANGNYIYFASATDTFDYKMLEVNFTIAEERQADLVVFGFKDPNQISIDGGIYHLPRLPHLTSQEDFRNHYRNFHHFFPYALHNKLYCRKYLMENRIKFHQIPLNEEAFFNLSVYKDIQNVAFNRSSYCTHNNKEKQIGYQEKLYEVNIELAKYLEAVIDYWGQTEEFRDLIVEAFFQAVHFEIENLCSQPMRFTIEEQERQMQEILENEKIQESLNDAKLPKQNSAFMRSLLVALQNGNSKAALQLASRRKETKKTTYRLSRWMRQLLNR